MNEEEFIYIRDLIKNSTLSIDDGAYLINAKWYGIWKVNCDFPNGSSLDFKMSEINNTPLMENGKIKNQLVEGEDYEVLSKPVWNFFFEKYGGGPAVKVRVIQDPISEKNVAIVKKISIKVWFHGKTINYSTSVYTTVKRLKHQAAETFLIDSSQYYICDYWNEEMGEPMEESKMLIHYNVMDGNTLYLQKIGAPPELPPKQSADQVLNKGVCGLSNLGNTCFFNAALQCLLHTEPLTNYFINQDWESEISTTNPLGTKGALSTQYVKLLKEYMSGKRSSLAPASLRNCLTKFAPHFAGYSQQDSQELLMFMLDGIHEDLNRVKQKPAVEPVEGDGTNDQEISETAWQRYKSRNDSIIVDIFHGQLRSHLNCPECHNNTVVFDPFCSLSLPVPPRRIMNPTFLYIPFDISEPVYKMAFYSTDYLNSKDILNYITDQGFHPHRVILAMYYPDSNEVKFVSKPYQTTHDRYLCVFEIPDEKAFFAPAFVKLMQRGFLWDSAQVLDGPMLIRLPNGDPSDLELEASCAKAFKHMWQGEKGKSSNSDIEALKKYRPFKDRSKPLAANRVSSFFGGNSFTPSKISSAVTERHIDIVINPEWLTAEHGFDIGKLRRKVVSKVEAKKADPEMTLAKCIEKFAESTVLDEQNQWFCPKCRKFVCADKKMDIWKAPSVLILHLKRFSQIEYGYLKSEAVVHYPDVLDMAPYIKGPRDDGDCLYRLFGVIEHHGGMSGGHYTAHAVVDSGWVFFNDSSATPCSASDAHNPNAYVLFYQKLDK